MSVDQTTETAPFYGIQEVMFGDGLALVCPRPACGFVELVGIDVLRDYALAHKPCAVCSITARIPQVEVVEA